MKQALMIQQKVEVELGPAMLSLSDRQRKFVVAYYDNGANGAEACRMAGYSQAEGIPKAQAWRLMQMPKIQAALKELGDAKFYEMAPKAINRMNALTDMPNHKDHFGAVKYVLGQAGFRETREVNVNTTISADDDMKAILRISHATGLDPTAVAGLNAVDVEFEEVPHDYSQEF